MTEIVLTRSGQVVRLPHKVIKISKDFKGQPDGLMFENPETDGVTVVYIDFTDVSLVTTSSAPLAPFEDEAEKWIGDGDVNDALPLRQPRPEM